MVLHKVSQATQIVATDNDCPFTLREKYVTKPNSLLAVKTGVQSIIIQPDIKLLIRSPKYDQESIELPARASVVSIPFNGTVCSAAGDEYPIRNNIIDLISDNKSYNLAQQTNNWTLTASVYEDLWRVRSLSFLTGQSFPIKKEMELLTRWMKPQPGNTYLDVGCSTALYARALKKAEPASIQVAIDFSMPMLEEARLKAEADETDLFLIRTDATEMPFFSGTFDGMVMGGTLNEFSDARKVMYECRRTIKKGGVFFMMHLIQSEAWVGRAIQASAGLSGLRFYSLKESNELFESTGFRIEEQYTKSIVNFSLLRAV